MAGSSTSARARASCPGSGGAEPVASGLFLQTLWSSQTLKGLALALERLGPRAAGDGLGSRPLGTHPALMRFVDDLGFALGWIAPEPRFMQRASHALVVDGRTWLVDPVAGDGVLERVRALGEPAGVVQLLDRHERDASQLAGELGVPLHRLPFAGVPGTPFRPVPILRQRFWQEVALWWPERRVLVCADAVGTAPYLLAPGERLAVSPLLRLRPPRALAALEPVHILVGHGEGLHDGATAAVRESLSGATQRLPAWGLGQLQGLVRRG